MLSMPKETDQEGRFAIDAQDRVRKARDDRVGVLNSTNDIP